MKLTFKEENKIGVLIFKDLYIRGYEEKQRCLCTSYSQIDMFSQCPYKWFLTYIKGNRKQISSESLSLGSAVHLTLEDYYNAMKDGKEWTLGEAIDLLEFNIDSQEIPFADEESEMVAREQHLKMMDGLVNGSNQLSKLLKESDIIACEKEFQYRVDLPFKVKYGDEIYEHLYIIGSIDLILKDKNDDFILVDYKSGKKPFEPKKLKTNLQLPIYSLVCKDIYGKLPARTLYYFTRIDVIQDVEVPALTKDDIKFIYYKNGNVKSVQKCIDDIMKELIDIFVRMYTIGEYKPTNTILCCWCDYHHRYGDAKCTSGDDKYWRKDIKPLRY